MGLRITMKALELPRDLDQFGVVVLLPRELDVLERLRTAKPRVAEVRIHQRRRTSGAPAGLRKILPLPSCGGG